MRPDPPLNITRAADLYEQFASGLLKRIARRYRGVDQQLIADAVVDAVLRLASSPDLVTEREFARRAYSRLRVLLRSDHRRRNREKAAASVTISAPAAPSTLEEMADHETALLYQARIARTDDERAVFGEWLAGYVNPDEIVSRTGFPPGKVNTLLARFRTRMGRLRREDRKEAGR